MYSFPTNHDLRIELSPNKEFHKMELRISIWDMYL